MELYGKRVFIGARNYRYIRAIILSLYQWDRAEAPGLAQRTTMPMPSITVSHAVYLELHRCPRTLQTAKGNSCALGEVGVIT